MPPRPRVPVNLGDLAQRATVTGLVGMGVSNVIYSLATCACESQMIVTWWPCEQIWGLWLTAAVWKSRRGDDAVSPDEFVIYFSAATRVINSYVIE